MTKWNAFRSIIRGSLGEIVASAIAVVKDTAREISIT